jgi:hypothetical protein
MKTQPRLKVWTVGELLDEPPTYTGIKITKSRKALTLRWGGWKNAPYDIELDQLKTERGILKWTLHLAEKSWVTRQQIEDFMHAALEVSEIDIHKI